MRVSLLTLDAAGMDVASSPLVGGTDGVSVVLGAGVVGGTDRVGVVLGAVVVGGTDQVAVVLGAVSVGETEYLHNTPNITKADLHSTFIYRFPLDLHL